MDYEIQKIICENKEKLQKKDITDITRYKIKYIKEYVKNWIYINCESNKYDTINFIDCMCNAGVYIDGTFSTAMEVLKEFIVASKKYSNINFCLFLNDYDADRIEVIKKVSSVLLKDNNCKIKVYYDIFDVNYYFKILSSKYDTYFKYGSNTILFVDPYNFGSVKIKRIIEFVNNNYCELIYNYFSSDYRRNIKNDYALSKKDLIKSSLEDIDEYKNEMDERDLMRLICNRLKEGNIKYTFSYQFRTKTNVPLYSIIFATRHLRGLEEIKDAYWKIFDGDPFYKNNSSSSTADQMSLFSNNKVNEDYYINDAKSMLYNKFKNQTVTYNDINVFILENTMLRSGQITNKLLMPLVKEGMIIKNNLFGKRNYKNDSFVIIGDNNE